MESNKISLKRDNKTIFLKDDETKNKIVIVSKTSPEELLKKIDRLEYEKNELEDSVSDLRKEKNELEERISAIEFIIENKE